MEEGVTGAGGGMTWEGARYDVDDERNDVGESGSDGDTRSLLGVDGVGFPPSRE